MQIGIFAKTFTGTDPETVLRAAARAGFDVAQYNMACSGLAAMPESIPNAAAVGDAATKTGTQIVAVSGTYNMIHPDAAVRERGHKRLEVLAAACAGMGTDLITLCTGTRDPDDQWRGHPDNQSAEAWADLRASMERAISIAQAHDIYLGIEPELANVINSASAARRLLDDMQSDRLRIILDPANLFEVETGDAQRRIVSDAVDLLAGDIVMGHAKDRLPGGAFTIAGQGILDYDHYLGVLRRAGFDGPVVAHGLLAPEAADVAGFLRRKLGALGL